MHQFMHRFGEKVNIWTEESAGKTFNPLAQQVKLPAFPRKWLDRLKKA